MKSSIFYGLVLFLCFGCQTDKLVFDEAKRLAENFVRGEGEREGTHYYAAEAHHPEYEPRYIEDALSINFAHRNEPWQNGVAALDRHLDSLLTASRGDPELNLRVDLQIITYMNYHWGVFPAPNGPEKYAASARNLERMLKYTQPIHWSVLAEALVLASPALSESRYRDIRQYIITGAERTLHTPAFYQLKPEEIVALQTSADAALSLLEQQK
jgi:hypothetical protein